MTFGVLSLFLQFRSGRISRRCQRSHFAKTMQHGRGWDFSAIPKRCVERPVWPGADIGRSPDWHCRMTKGIFSRNVPP